MSVYPSDAPLPKFTISKADGKLIDGGSLGTIIEVAFDCTISNIAELEEYFGSRGYDTNQFSFFFDKRYGALNTFPEIYFSHGMCDKGINPQFISAYTGNWISLDVYLMKMSSDYSRQLFDISPVIHFCDLYIPSLSSLSFDVWTDLQFQTTPTPPTPCPFKNLERFPRLYKFVCDIWAKRKGKGT